jgi:hypothetical protein
LHGRFVGAVEGARFAHLMPVESAYKLSFAVVAITTPSRQTSSERAAPDERSEMARATIYSGAWRGL